MRSLRASLFAVVFVGTAVAYTVTGSSSTAKSGGTATTTDNNNAVVGAVPKTFRALVGTGAGSSFREVARVTELDTPTPTELGEDEVLIRVRYAGINGGCETFRARGEHAFVGNKGRSSFRLGAEGVGIVAAVGSEVDRVAIGDAVCFVGSAFSEYDVAKASTVWKVPTASPECVGLRISALTSCAMLEGTGKIRPGETVLITAAAGGAGHFAVQFAKLAGCTVIGTCGSEDKARLLKDLGCDHVVNHRTTQDVREELRRIAPDGLDCVLEGVGGRMLETALDCLAPEGRLLQIGYISEYPHADDAVADDDAEETEKADVGFDVAEIFWKRQTVRRGKQTIYGNAWPSDVGESPGRVVDLYEKGALRSVVDETRTFAGLDDIPDAIEHMLGGTTMGKVVVEIP